MLNAAHIKKNFKSARTSGTKSAALSGCRIMALLQLPKLITRVRFPSPAPIEFWSHVEGFFDGGCRDRKKPVQVAGFFVSGIWGALLSKHRDIRSATVSGKRLAFNRQPSLFNRCDLSTILDCLLTALLRKLNDVSRRSRRNQTANATDQLIELLIGIWAVPQYVHIWLTERAIYGQRDIRAISIFSILFIYCLFYLR